MSAGSHAIVGHTGEVQYAGDVIMRRHHAAPPGFWRVSLLPAPTVCAFFRLDDLDNAYIETLAIVDDFGNLVRVSS